MMDCKTMNCRQNGLFHAIFFIDANSGLTLLSQTFSQTQYDEDLISGMLRALDSFINHLCYSNQVEIIQEINFKGSRIVYERVGPVIGAAISKKQNQDMEHFVLKTILEDFYQQCGSYLIPFFGNVVPFHQYRNRLMSFIELDFSKYKEIQQTKEKLNNSRVILNQQERELISTNRLWT
jgi:hypothetical protein